MGRSPAADAVATHWGRRIAKARKAQGITRAELATAVGVSRTAVYRWESGASLVHPRHHVALADALGTPAAFLFDYPTDDGVAA